MEADTLKFCGNCDNLTFHSIYNDKTDPKIIVCNDCADLRPYEPLTILELMKIK